MYKDYLIFSPDGFNYNYNVSKNILSIIIIADVIHPEKTNYDIIYKSYVAIVFEIITVIATSIAFVKYKLLKR